MKVYYLTKVYPDGSFSYPKRLLGARSRQEVELRLGKYQRHYPTYKFEITEEDECF